MKRDVTVLPDGDVPDDPGHRYKKIYATVNAAAFGINQVMTHFERLRALLIEYDSETRGLASFEWKAGGHQVASIELDYPKRNEIVGLTWDLIDWLDRVRKLLQIIAGAKREQQPWYRSAMQALGQVEEVRHVLQHFDERMKEFIEGEYPLHGAVTATFPGRLAPTHTRILLSTPARFAGDRSITIAQVDFLPKVEGEVDGVIFSIGRRSIDLSEVMRVLEKVKIDMGAFLQAKYGFRWPT